MTSDCFTFFPVESFREDGCPPSPMITPLYVRHHFKSKCNSTEYLGEIQALVQSLSFKLESSASHRSQDPDISQSSLIVYFLIVMATMQPTVRVIL